MLLDAELRLSNAQDLSSGTASGVVSTNSIQMNAAGREIGAGMDLYFYLIITTAFEGSGDTLDVEYVSATNAALTSGLVVHEVIRTIPAQSAAGYDVKHKVTISDDDGVLQYVGLRYYARGSGALTAGAVTAYLTDNVDSWKAYPKGYSIS